MNIQTTYFEITNQCNLNCTTCYNRSGVNNQREEISVDELRNGIEIFTGYNLRRVIISGGEPTLHSEFKKVLDLIDRYPDILFGIVTNGTNHNEKLIDLQNTRSNLTFQVSLDGSNDEFNAKTRGKGNFEKAKTFAKKIKSNRKPLLKMVISQNNINDIENFYLLALSLNFVPEFTFINHRGNARKNWDNISLSPQQKLSIINQVYKLNKEHNVNAFIPLCSNGCNFTSEKQDLSIYIKPNGDIQPCSLLYSSEHTLGNIKTFNKDCFLKSLCHISSLAIQRQSLEYNCGRCILKDNCSKGCIGEAYILHGDVADDGGCEFRKIQLVGYDLKYGR